MNKLIQSPIKLFIYASAFCFSSGKGRCFSPGFKAMIIYYKEKISNAVFNRDRLKHYLFKMGKF